MGFLRFMQGPTTTLDGVAATPDPGTGPGRGSCLNTPQEELDDVTEAQAGGDRRRRPVARLALPHLWRMRAAITAATPEHRVTVLCQASTPTAGR